MYVSSNDPAGSSTESLLLPVVHALPLQVIASTATVVGLSVVGRVCSAQGIFVVDADDHGLRLAKVGGVKRRLAQHRKESVDRRRVVPALNEEGSMAYADCCRSEASTQAARQTDGQTPTSRLAHTERGRQTHTAKTTTTTNTTTALTPESMTTQRGAYAVGIPQGGTPGPMIRRSVTVPPNPPMLAEVPSLDRGVPQELVRCHPPPVGRDVRDKVEGVDAHF